MLWEGFILFSWCKPDTVVKVGTSSSMCFSPRTTLLHIYSHGVHIFKHSSALVFSKPLSHNISLFVALSLSSGQRASPPASYGLPACFLSPGMTVTPKTHSAQSGSSSYSDTSPRLVHIYLSIHFHPVPLCLIFTVQQAVLNKLSSYVRDCFPVKSLTHVNCQPDRDVWCKTWFRVMSCLFYCSCQHFSFWKV